MKIQAVFYANPDRYPPIINSMRLLVKAGYQIELLCRDTGEKPNIIYPPSVQVRRIKAPTENPLQEYIFFLTKVLNSGSKSTSLFIGHDMHGFLPARLLATFYQRPLVYQSHELIDTTDKLRSGTRLIFAFHKYFANSSDLMVVPDKDRAKIMKNLLKLKREPLIVTNSPLQTAVNSENRLRATLLSQGYAFEQIVFRQGSIGPSHAIETTIRSIPLWQNTKWGFVIMGAGSKSYIASIRGLAAELGVTDRFAILPPVCYDEIFSFTGGANLGHSLYTPIDSNNRFSTTASNKLMEYMAAGLPLLVSDRPSLRKFVETYQCGLPADDSSPESIANTVNTLLGNSSMAESMGRCALQAFETEFSYEKQFAPVIENLRVLAQTIS